MYKIFQNEIRKPTVTNIDEMHDKNFTFYMQPGFKLYFNDSELNQRYLVNKSLLYFVTYNVQFHPTEEM